MTKSWYVLRQTFADPNRKTSLFLIGLLTLFILSAFDQIQPPKPISTASIAIITPSSGSIITSPIKLDVSFACNPGDVLRIELINKQEKLLFRKLIIPDCRSNMSYELKELIFFDTPTANTKTRLAISLTDPEDVPRAIASTELLLSRDNTSINKTNDSQSTFIIISPAENSLLSHGRFPVSGWIRPLEQTPIILELLTETGGLVSSRQIAIPQENAGDYFYFDVVIPYSVPRILNAILVIRQMGSEIPGNIALESFTYQLSP
jgi:hypothetical protein